MAILGTHRDRAYRLIRQKIIDGVLTPGRKVSDVALAKEIGASRSPVREAIGRLASEGLVEQIPHYGTFIRKLDTPEAIELLELREMLEGYAAAKAAKRITDEQLAELEAILGGMHRLLRAYRKQGGIGQKPSVEREEWVRLDVAFHLLIQKASGCHFVSKIITDFHIMTNSCSVSYAHPIKSRLGVDAYTWRAHTRIFRALCERNPDKASYWARHHIHQLYLVVVSNAKSQPHTQIGPEESGFSTERSEQVRSMIRRMERYSIP